MSERGSITFWVLGLSFALMTLGVLSVDLWQLIGERRELVSLADASATAASSAVDESQWRASQRLVLDRDEARRRAWAVFEDRTDLEPVVEFDIDGVTVRVSVTRTVRTALLGLAGQDLVTVGAASEARPTVRD
jgi:hypothetical protein